MKMKSGFLRFLGIGNVLAVAAGCGSGLDVQEPASRSLSSPTASSFATSLVQGEGSVQELMRDAQPRAIQSWEDCVSLDLATVAVKYVGGEWKIVDGPSGSHWAFSFGSQKAEAEKALQIIKAYRFSHSCFVSRPGPKMTYQLTAPGDAAVTRTHRVAGEDCIAFDSSKVEAKWFPAPLNTWKIVQGNMWMLDFGLDQAGVYKALRVIQSKGFNQQCFVGRPGPSFSYWKTMR